ncbi:hypothetical protein L3X38_011737 [Prunus dulcis]|uniref:Ubiquitin-like protease family profile domain-containing protein n=1 Tax=Prunus dulcis TaxID=3755 RepID=A0AAD4WKE5_PRUDU|nr:hypothetical protein L3X38_011737 [Prunus dulcis]
MEVVREETKKIEVRAKESVLEAVRAEREILLKKFSQLIPNFDPNLLGKTPITPIPQEQSPKNPMSDKASCSNVRALVLEEDNPTNDANAAEKQQDETTTLKPANKTIRIHIPEKVFGTEQDTFLLCEDILQFASMVEIGSTVIALYMRYLFAYIKIAKFGKPFWPRRPWTSQLPIWKVSHRSKYLLDRLKNADGDQFYLVLYNPGGHWVSIIVRPTKETV